MLDCIYYISRFSRWEPQQLTYDVRDEELDEWLAIIENRQDLIFFYAREDEMNV